LRGQAFTFDGLLALALALMLAYSLAPAARETQGSASARLARECGDLANAFLEDPALYGNASKSLREDGLISGGRLETLNASLAYYAGLLGAREAALEIRGIQTIPAISPATRIAATERCCFPIAPKNGTHAFIACIEVGE
jgi:hypothetical protein